MTFVLIDLGILGGSALAGYFLAGRTLQPIKDMVDEQNRFITDASHELRTPLTSLKSEIEVNLRDKDLNLNGAKKLLKSNLEEVNNLQNLSDNLIKLTQYQKGNNGLDISEVSIKSVAQEAIKKVSGQAKIKKIKIVDEDSDYAVEGDKQLLSELLAIFLDNAIKYSPENSKIEISTDKNNGYINIHVTDQGIGVDEADIPHLFDRFYRADESRTKSKVKGYGLGLSIAKQIADKHRGIINVKSGVGQGSEFTIALPTKHRK